MRSLLRTGIERFPSFLNRKRNLCLAHAVAMFLALSPLLLGGRLLAEPDTIGLHYPFFQFLFTTPDLWGWNTLNFHGFPSMIGESTATSPVPLLLSLIVSPTQSLHWSIFLFLTAAASLFSLLLREKGKVSPLAAWVSGVALSASIFWTVPYAAGMATLFSIVALLWSTAESTRRPGFSFLMSTAVLTHAWYAVHFVHLPFVWLSAGGYALFLLHEKRRECLSRAVSPLLILLFAFGLSVLLALPKILPVLLFASLSFRGGGLPWEELTLGGITLFTPLRFLFPFLEFPLLDFGQAPLFFGIGSVACALIALTQKRRSVRFLGLAYLVSALLALEHSPLLWLLHRIPPFSYIRREGLWLTLGNTAVVTLSAIGFDALLRGEAPAMRRRLSRSGLSIALAALVVSISVTITLVFFHDQIFAVLRTFFDTHLSFRTSGLPREHYYGVIEDYLQQTGRTLSLLRPRFLFPLLSLFAVSTLLSETLWRKLGSLRAPLLALVFTGTTVLVLSVQHSTIARTALPLSTPVSAILSRKDGPVFSVLPNLGKYLFADPVAHTLEETIAFQMTLLSPNRNLWYGIPSIDYFDNIMSRRMGKLLAWVGSEVTQAEFPIALAKMSLLPEEKISKVLERKDVLDFLNAKTLLSLWPMAHPTLTLRDTLHLTEHRIPLYVYENKAARPLAYFADAVVMMPPDEEKAFAKVSSEKWPGRRTLIECTACPTFAPTGDGTIAVREEQPAMLSFQTGSATPQWLIVSVNNLPGWRVTVDGRVTEPALAFTTFFAIPLAEGSHTVDMTFSFRTLFRESLAWALDL